MENENFRKLLNDWPEKAVETLFDYFYAKLVSVSLRRTQDREAAEDIVQEAFAYIWQKHKIIARENINIEPYLMTIVRNKSVTWIEQSIRARSETVLYFNTVSFIEEPDEELLIIAEKKKLIWKIICEFPRRERQCLILKFYQGMPGAEIARTLEISIKSVERSLTSAYKRFRKQKHRIS